MYEILFPSLSSLTNFCLCPIGGADDDDRLFGIDLGSCPGNEGPHTYRTPSSEKERERERERESG